MSVFAPSVVNLWKAIESYGVDPAPLFDGQGISLTLPIDPCLRLSYEKVDHIRAAAVEATGDAALGLRTAEVYAPSHLGALGYACLNSLTLTEISMLLGFSEPSSFSRAFKNWTGSTPTEARQARQ